jgi:type II secretory pathway component PulL
MTGQQKQRLSILVILVVASVFVVGIGAQAYLAQREDAEQDRQDRQYAECLTNFAAELVKAIEVRAEANMQLDRVRDKKDRLLDQLIVFSLEAQQRGYTEQEDVPPRFLREYQRILAARVEAQEEFTELKKRLDTTLKDNPYVSPRVTCKR